MAKKFSNVPANLQDKMERCVIDVKASGQDKQSAIAICFDSVVKGKSLDDAIDHHYQIQTFPGDKIMSKKRQKKKARQQKNRKNATKAKDRTLLEETVDPLLDEELEEKSEDAEEKDLSEDKDFHGPTSFEELDASREAQEKINEADNVIWDARWISDNILFSDNDVEEKSTLLTKLAEGLRNKLNEVLNKNLDDFDIETQLELLEIKSLLDNMSFLEKNLDPKKINIKKSLELLGNEIANGGEVAVKARENYHSVLEEARKVVMAQPGKNNPNSLMVFKDQKGTPRWVGWVSNNFKDREGDILTEEAHKEYVEFLDAHPQAAPEFRIWHQKGTARKSPADWWSYENDFLLMSGVLETQEAVSLLKAGQKEILGMSHGFFVMDRDPDNKNIITKYRTFEVSDLPQKFAANSWTNIEAISKEILTMDTQKANYIKDQIGEEQLASLLQSTEEAQKLLNSAGIEQKDITPEEKEDKGDSNEPTPTLEPAVLKAIGEGLGMDQLSEQFQKILENQKEVMALIPALAGEVKELKKSDDEKIADQFIPPVSVAYAWMNKTAEGNVLDPKNEEDQKLLDAIPTESFIKVSGVN